jgi:TolB protein
MRKLQCVCAAALFVVSVQCGSASAPVMGDAPEGSAPEIISPPGRIAFVTEGSPFNGALYIVNSDGSGLRKLAGGAAYYTRPRWSPDRRRIAFGRFADGSPSEILVIDVDGKSGTVRLAEGAEPAWSPDGTKIVFASNGGAPLGSAIGIYVMNADGSGIRQLTSPNNFEQCSVGASASDFNPDWSPDGKRILFERDFNIDDINGFDCGLDGYGRITNVYVMNADGTGAQRLRPVDLWNTDAEPAWSPDGQFVAFSKQAGGVFVIRADGSSGQQQVVTNYPEFSPAWSADGKNLLFAAAAPPTNFMGIWELASGSTRLIGIPAAIGLVLDPAWSR